MTWTQLHERMAFMNELIQAAESDPEGALELTDKACEVSRLFGGEEGLLLSLRHRWMTTLTAKLDQAEHENLSVRQARVDLIDAQPGLYALMQIAARRSLRVRTLAGAENRAVDLFDGTDTRRLTVA